MDIGQERRTPVTARVKLTLCTDDRFFGPGVCELLEKIRETGSIRAAANRMDLSYTKAWKILTRVSGGRNGGSSTLTEAGGRAVRDFREIETRVREYASEQLKAHYRTFMPEEQEK